jgi:hypothetical protein
MTMLTAKIEPGVQKGDFFSSKLLCRTVAAI